MTNRLVSHAALELLCQQTREAVIAVDQNGTLCVFNAAAEGLFGVRADEVLGCQIGDHPALEPLGNTIQQVMDSGEAAHQSVRRASGRRSRALVLFAPASSQPAAAPSSDRSRLSDTMHEFVHELKRPITNVKSTLDLIEASGSLSEKQIDFVQKSRHSLGFMLSLVHELRGMAWMEADEPLRTIRTDLSLLVRHALSQMEGHIQNHGIHIHLDLPEVCPIQADEAQLQSAIINLADNAVKYSPNGGPVNISVHVDEQDAIFEVEDRGIGIAAEHLPNLFQRFYRVRTPETRRIEGSGLGLAIVKTIVEKHGGRVFVRSDPGQGSVFGFALPRSLVS